MALRTLVTLSLLSPCALALATPLPQTVQGGPSGAGAAGHQLRYSLHNLGLAVDGQKFYPPFAEGRVVVVVPEISQGGVDLNGDGDVLDEVLHLVDPLTGAVTNLGLAHGGIGSSSHERFCFAASEAQHGGVDLNGDGDTLDHVAFLHDATSGVTTNLGLAVQFQGAISADLLVLGVSEAGQGGSDLNADGDTLDSVVFVHELSGGLTHNLGLALSSPFGPISVHAGLARFALHEVVHWVQGVEGTLDESCKSSVAAEREAYYIQRLFLDQYGTAYPIGTVLPTLGCEE